MVKLRRDLEESHVQRDATVTGMKKKQSDSVAEMNEQIDQLSKMKQKVDKDKDQIVKEINDVRGATDEVGRSKVSYNFLGLLFFDNSISRHPRKNNLEL